MGFVMLGVTILALVTVITMYLEWSIGQIAEDEKQWRILSMLAGAVGLLVLDLTIIVSPVGEALWSYFTTHSAHYITIGPTLEIVISILAIDGVFIFLCYGAGKDSFNSRPRPRH